MDTLKTYSIKDASKLLGISEQGLRLALQQRLFNEFGIAVKHKDEYSYYINRKRKKRKKKQNLQCQRNTNPHLKKQNPIQK